MSELQIEHLLADIRQALRDGEYLRLSDLVPAAQAALADLSLQEDQQMTALRSEVQKTARLVAAAVRGLRAGQRRIAELMRLEAGFLSYDAGGGHETALREPGLSRQL